MSKVILGFGQTIYDIAIQETGSVEGVFVLMKRNPTAIANLNAQPEAGTQLKVEEVIDKNVLNYYTSNKLKPASGNGLNEAAEPLLNIDLTPLLNADGTPLLNAQPQNILNVDGTALRNIDGNDLQNIINQ